MSNPTERVEYVVQWRPDARADWTDYWRRLPTFAEAVGHRDHLASINSDRTRRIVERTTVTTISERVVEEGEEG